MASSFQHGLVDTDGRVAAVVDARATVEQIAHHCRDMVLAANGRLPSLGLVVETNHADSLVEAMATSHPRVTDRRHEACVGNWRSAPYGTAFLCWSCKGLRVSSTAWRSFWMRLHSRRDTSPVNTSKEP